MKKIGKVIRLTILSTGLFSLIILNSANAQNHGRGRGNDSGLVDPDDRSADGPEDSAPFRRGRNLNPGNDRSEYNREMRIGSPKLSGSGCNPNEVSVVLSPDKKALSILFDNYITEAGGNTGVKMDRKLCNLRIPFEVPAGYRMTVTSIDYRGFNSLPSRANTRLVTSYNFADGTRRMMGARVKRDYTFTGPIEEEYLISSQIASARSWSGCGKGYVMNVDMKLQTQTNPQMEPALSTLDSIDTGNPDEIRYSLLWEKCEIPRSARQILIEKARERNNKKKMK